MLKIDFAMQLYDSFEEFLAGYENTSGCVVLCRDYFDREVSELYKQITFRNKLVKVILYLSFLEVPDVVRAIKLIRETAYWRPNRSDRIDSYNSK